MRDGRTRLTAALLLLALGGVPAPARGGPRARSGEAVQLKGVIEAGHFDDFERRRAEYFAFLHRRGRRVPIVIRRAPVGLRARRRRVTGEVLQAYDGTRVDVRGRWQGGRLLVTAIAARGEARPRALAVPSGPRRLAVFLLNFANDRAQPFTADAVRTALFTNPKSVNAFYVQDSFGTVSFRGKLREDGDVIGWLEIARSSAPCDYRGWADAARALAVEQGHDLSGYDHHMFVFPRTTACQWSGLGIISGRDTWINGSLSTYLLTHELGHNLGANHASTWRCTAGNTPVSVSDACEEDEYGDPFDVMGYGPRLHHNHHRVHLGFLPPSATYEITPGDVHVTVYATPTPTPTPTLVRVRRPGAAGFHPFYYLEYRRPQTPFDTFAPTDPVVNGVSIRVGADWGGTETSSNRPALLDMTPDTATFTDAALAVGRTFRDPAGFTITTVATYPDRAVVRLREGCL
jgi:hypothetical protein